MLPGAALGRSAKDGEAQHNDPASQERGPAAVPGRVALDLKAVYDEWAEFVWLSLQRLGVRSADLDDVCHDVFLVVHRKLGDYDGRAKVNSWLFGICARVAANYRRRARFRLERSGHGVSDESAAMAAPEWSQPEQTASRRQTMAQLEAALARMNPIKRAILVMFEVEGLSCGEISAELGLPIGTIYSRLHAARKLILEELGGGMSSRMRKVP